MKNSQWFSAKLIFLLFAAVSMSTLAQEIHAPRVYATDNAEQQGLLWRVERPGTSPNWLFGTIHSDDPRVTRVPPAVRDALGRADRYIMEVILDDSALTSTSAAMFFSEKGSLRAMLKPDLFARAAQAMAGYGMPEMLVENMKPWAVALTLSMPKSETGLVLDLILYGAAIEQGKPAHGLETPQEQFNIFDSLPLKDQITFLKEALEQLPQLKTMIAQLQEAYLARDLSRLVALSDKYASVGDSRLSRKMMAELLDKRNIRMAQRIEPYLKKGGSFIAVGALHLPGETGILKRLKGRGYRVSPIY